MATLKSIKTRITSVKNTHKITKAMKMVAAAKLRGSEERLRAGRPYAERLDEVIGNLYRRTETEGFPLLEGKKEVKKIELLVITSDRGLCGSFNSNILRYAWQTRRKLVAEGKEVSISVIGRKAADFFRYRDVAARQKYLNILGDHNYGLAIRIGDEMVEAFQNDTVDEVRLVYNEFVSAIAQRIVDRPLVPVILQSLERPAGMEAIVDYRFEPQREAVLAELLPMQIHYQLFKAFLESYAAEMGARMSAMDAATTNAEEMIGKLTLQYNRARQAAITNELMEIINGANAIS
ncbi:MAG: ATP synthase F1 subunit gamma [Myxococcales bacterium]|nr:ATP synthase F1 subunit gamma [Myxococcales bacterium]